MKFLHSIRWRLQIWYGLVLIAVLSGFGVAVYRVERERQIRRTDEELQRRLQVLAGSRHPVPNARPPRQQFALRPENAALFDQQGAGNYYYVVWLRSNAGPIRSSSAPADVPMPPESGATAGTRQRGSLQETYLLPAPGDCLLVGHPRDREIAELRQFAAWLWIAGGGVLLVGLLGGGWLIHRSLQPIRDISLAAQKIATGDLTQRIPGSPPGSELGQLINVLNSTFARLDAAFTQQARFTADAAHELRTPVSILLAQAQDGLAGECNNPEHAEAFAASERAARRMRALIASLLELARLDAGQETPLHQPCDLASITAESVELLRPLAEARGIQVHTNLQFASFSGDAVRIAQVVTNLLTNAVEYNHDGGEIQISTSPSSDAATLTVRNTGPGIAEEDLPKIFERFYRADKARTGSGGSVGHTGLGLAITRAIVLAHGGTIQATSQSGKGATFRVTLPNATSIQDDLRPADPAEFVRE